MYRSLREERHSPSHGIRSLQHVLRRDQVADIHNFHLRGDAVDHPFHSAYKTVCQAEIGCDGYNRHRLLLNLFLDTDYTETTEKIRPLRAIRVPFITSWP